MRRQERSPWLSKLGVYICSGCAIGDSIDTQKLAKVARRELKAPVCLVHPFLCGHEGLELIRKDLASGAVDGVVIAACSPRVKTEAFAFDPAMVFERVNLREHVAWCHKPKDEDTQMLAEDYLRMGIVKAKKMEPLEPVSEPVSKKLLVVGGGVAGMTAALEAAEAGYEVVLVEKQPQLGGFRGHAQEALPSGALHRAEPTAADKSSAVMSHPRIQVFTSARILKTEGQPGMFDVTVQTDGQDPDRSRGRHRHGHRLEAVRRLPRLDHLGYGLSPDVITNVELERMAAGGPIVRPSDGRPAESVLFVQCAGSRDPNHLPYCSSVCCMATLKHAAYIHEQNPDAQVYIVYKDMRTPGQYERFYRTAQDHPFNFLTKGEVDARREGPRRRARCHSEGHSAGRADPPPRGPGGAGHRHGAQLRRRRGHPGTGRRQADGRSRARSEASEPRRPARSRN